MVVSVFVSSAFIGIKFGIAGKMLPHDVSDGVLIGLLNMNGFGATSALAKRHDGPLFIQLCFATRAALGDKFLVAKIGFITFDSSATAKRAKLV